MRAATAVQVLQDFCFIACFTLLVIAHLKLDSQREKKSPWYLCMRCTRTGWQLWLSDCYYPTVKRGHLGLARAAVILASVHPPTRPLAEKLAWFYSCCFFLVSSRQHAGRVAAPSTTGPVAAML